MSPDDRGLLVAADPQVQTALELLTHAELYAARAARSGRSTRNHLDHLAAAIFNVRCTLDPWAGGLPCCCTATDDARQP